MSAHEKALARDLVARARLTANREHAIADAQATWKRLEQQRGGISSRELDVLRCMSRGLTRAMTAELLYVEETTVQRHLQNVRAKLRAKNTTQACCEAIRRGLIP